MRKIDFPKLIAAILISQAAGVIGSVFTITSIPAWYAALNKPFFTPPSWVFGPVWITLYTLMGIAAYLVWENGIEKKEVKEAIGVFGLQLGLNALWPIVFFGLHELLLGFVVIVLLWLAILLTIIKFDRVSRNAALLLLPYIAWVSIAAALNLAIVVLNS